MDPQAPPRDATRFLRPPQVSPKAIKRDQRHRPLGLSINQHITQAKQVACVPRLIQIKAYKNVHIPTKLRRQKLSVGASESARRDLAF